MPICTLAHVEPSALVMVTYDPDTRLYALHMERAGGWPEAEVFALRFEDGAALTISTDRHVVEGTRLTVIDRGFGNVLRGLEANTKAVAVLGDLSVEVSLTDAAPAVAAFRDCPAEGLV
ncbi:excinuclease ABC subunit B [Jannaschia pagri]|uniref:excinuclease ABC subunit B n=1 Tax=Jannaschia pagri TaxID=2829797 RepID=UPI001C7D3541|nr:excinuclease ABC subunit B [Jannaschia sp. AI_62]